MEIGLVGLGKMGGNMVIRLRRGGHRVVVFDRDADRVRQAVARDGAIAAAGLEELRDKLNPPRVIWLMLPAGDPTGDTITELAGHLAAGDVVIDGGNSRFQDSRRRAEKLAVGGIRFLDAGTSGGVWGLTEGYCLMVGGDAEAFDHVEPLLATLAPESGYAHVGPAGAGHYVKMVHNGIEYALMQAYAEGFDLLDAGPFEVDMARVARLWMKGSVIRSWLLELTAGALEKNPGLAGIEPWVADSGEGRWTVLAAVDAGVPAPAIALSLFTRFASRRQDAFALKLLAALRDEFGGHGVRTDTETDP